MNTEVGVGGGWVEEVTALSSPPGFPQELGSLSL